MVGWLRLVVCMLLLRQIPKYYCTQIITCCPSCASDYFSFPRKSMCSFHGEWRMQEKQTRVFVIVIHLTPWIGTSCPCKSKTIKKTCSWFFFATRNDYNSRTKRMARWWQLKYFLFSSLFGEDSYFDKHIFQMGWFNHQPDGLFGKVIQTQ